ncbi:Adenosine deaminase [Pleurostoma richardsiae]|uniref:adenosine deaminase n=1 Tax=Pleurostoma richardsiae TaxID=41990 RepID=A0AA38RQ66_9PEZI|nr:Adenosine deaminase [Pleurostoma richardsiae]
MPPFTNDEWEELSQELPKQDDSVMKAYLQGRENLIAEEKKQRSDYSFRQSLSPIAKKACDIVAKIREEEQRTTWTSDLEEKIAVEQNVTVHPGMMFNLAKESMEKTKLWQIVRKMPKGSLLHAHLDAMVDFGFLFGVLLDTPGMHISCTTSHLATEETRRDGDLVFRFFKNPRTSGPSIWDETYEPGTFILLTQAADAFPVNGRAGFLKWLRSRCTLSETDNVEQHHGVDHIWMKFKKCFVTIGTMVHYEPILRQFLQRLMSLFYADGVFWAELRFAWPLNYYREGQETPESDYVHMFTVISQEVDKFKSSDAGKGFWGVRMIWTSLRFLPTRTIVQDMDNAISTKIQFPELLAGYDCVGQEDDGRPLRDLLPELLWFRQQCAAEGVEMPFFFHAGECLGDGSPTDNNLFDAVLLGTRRIGHGFSLYKHPLLVDLVKDKRILVESCPISNEVLRLCGSVLSHPLPALLARGVACALCNDDPAIMGQDTAGMTHDFWQALQGWDNLGLAGLGSLAENSVRWSCFEDQTAEEWTRDVREASLGGGVKAQRLKEWGVAWEKFCLWVVTEFGEQYGEEL